MPRSYSSHSASPTSYRPRRRSPARRPASPVGSQYEMDMDALGLESTLDATGLEDDHKPKVDVVDTSDIEGPEDFTMNMTYWMTTDLPAAQIKSRKEANVRVEEINADAPLESDQAHNSTEEGTHEVLESSAKEDADIDSTSPTVRVKGTTKSRQTSRASSESSMENEEKVRSYLSALPDSDLGDALTSTPLRVSKHNTLQVPNAAAPKARSLQATVEDYDTPRKPTQETVIHHPTAHATNDHTEGPDAMRCRIAELQSCLDQSQLASKTRITELETILSFNRSELDDMRKDGYKQKEIIAGLERDKELQRESMKSAQTSFTSQLRAQQDELNAKIQEFGAELRLQGLAKLRNQNAEFEQHLKALEESKRMADEQARAKEQLLEQVKAELDQLRHSKQEELEIAKRSHTLQQQQKEQEFTRECNELLKRLSALQTRGDDLQADLTKATAEAKSAREEAQAATALNTTAQTPSDDHSPMISALELRIRSLQSELDSSRAEVSVRDEQLRQNTNLKSRLETVQSQLRESTAELAKKEEELLQSANSDSRMQDLQRRLNTCQTQLKAALIDLDTKEEQLGRNIDLESRLQALRMQLESSRADAAAKDQQILRHIDEQERLDQQLNTARGRIEGLETTISTLRQQLAEEHHASAKARTAVERLEKDLEDTTERLQTTRAEADRRAADLERRLSKVKELKAEAENRSKELQSQYEELVEDNEAKMVDVRSKAEDAVRKAGALIEHERAEKRRLAKQLKASQSEAEQLRTEAAQQTDAAEEQSSSASSSDESCPPSPMPNAKDTEIANLHTLLRKQASAIKTLKSSTSSLRKENARLKSDADAFAAADTEPAIDLQAALNTLRLDKDDLTAELAALREENTRLNTQIESSREDFDAVNKAMDERLAAMLSKAVKERAKLVVGKRDEQWAAGVAKVQAERDVLGRVLLREWGRQEVGGAREGEKQPYRYQYVKRS
ncbi:hypothetical protein BDV95DRAFT_573385 [Massariosphaeria phaeospora]|uniref:Uncharacterized protein n=1 Tax=Massariosphaeria phaeospora TaxID=100035 RepID=A0A7C8I594_9PLEO|nr:hypothetical protein BDV95DRAFT_573385 [Massariosphaeria phaeospora]